MVIYVDVLIFLNLIINYSILSVVKRFMNLKAKTSRLILASFVSSLFTLCVFLNIDSIFFSILLKLVCALSMCFIAFMKVDFLSYIKSICATFVFTMVFSAIVISYYQIVKPKNMVILNDTLYIHISPLPLLIISSVIYIMFLVLKRMLSGNSFDNIVSLKILLDGCEYSLLGKVDTGNSVTEPFSGAPVIVAEKSIFNNFEKTFQRIIPYHSLGHNGVLYGIKAQKVFINDKEIKKDIYIGMYNGKISTDFKSIINSDILR